MKLPGEKNVKINFKDIIPKNAGAHNSIYRGKDISDLWYNGTLSKQIANGTFDDIFIGDYIIGKTSGKKYIVADLDYYIHTGDAECKTRHILVIPERIIGTAKMNDTNSTAGAYANSKMRKENLEPFKTVIQNDFGDEHILTYKNYFANAITTDYESGGTWYSAKIELMNEKMVYGNDVFHNILYGNNIPNNYTIDKTQLSLFRLVASQIVALNDAGERYWYWLRDSISAFGFAMVGSNGNANCGNASTPYGVRPYFLLY